MKTDRFAVEVEHTVDYFSAHRNRILLYVGIAAGVVLLAIAGWLLMKRQRAAREQALAEAIQMEETPVGAGTPSAFPTDEIRRQVAMKAFGAIAADHSSSREAQVAEYYMGGMALDAAKSADAEKFFKQAAAGGDKDYSSLAKLSLAQLYFSLKRPAEAESLLRDLMNHPTDLVSKEEATFVLAKGLVPTRPDEARKMLERLRLQPGAASQLAISAISDLPVK